MSNTTCTLTERSLRKRAADLGVRMPTIGNTLRLAVSGDGQISFFKEGQEQYPVKIRVLENQRGNIAEIGRLTVPPTMSFKLQGQSKILDETTANMIMAIGLAMIFVSLCLFLTLLLPQRAQNARRGPRLLVPVAYVQFDALERAVVGSGAKAWLAKVSAATVGRLRPAAESRQG